MHIWKCAFVLLSTMFSVDVANVNIFREALTMTVYPIIKFSASSIKCDASPSSESQGQLVGATGFSPSDWPEKSASGISNASGTRSVRVNPQGLSRSCCKLSPVKIPSPQPAAPGSPSVMMPVLPQIKR